MPDSYMWCYIEDDFEDSRRLLRNWLDLHLRYWSSRGAPKNEGKGKFVHAALKTLLSMPFGFNYFVRLRHAQEA